MSVKGFLVPLLQIAASGGDTGPLAYEANPLRFSEVISVPWAHIRGLFELRFALVQTRRVKEPRISKDLLFAAIQKLDQEIKVFS